MPSFLFARSALPLSDSLLCMRLQLTDAASEPSLVRRPDKRSRCGQSPTFLGGASDFAPLGSGRRAQPWTDLKSRTGADHRTVETDDVRGRARPRGRRL